MYSILRRAALLFLLVFVNHTLFAQKQVNRQSIYWLRYYNTLNINEKWNFQTEWDTRHFFVNSRQQQFIFHSRVAYKPSDPWYFSAGITGSWQKSQDPATFPRPITPELRFVQEGSYTKLLLRDLSANYRLRIEERFVSNHTGPFDRDYNFSFRHRYRFQLTYLVKKLDIALRGSEEVFVNTSPENLFGKLDQNRVYLAVEKRFTPALSMELGYMNIHQSIRTKNIVNKRDIARLTLYHTLNLHRKD